MRTFFTSDQHFGHANIIKYTDRLFETVEEMDQHMIAAWNSVVGPDDHVYHLGDFTLGDIDKFNQYISRLNGAISIVPGSHDWRWIDSFMLEDHYSASGHFVELLPPLYSLDFSEYSNEQGYPLVIVLCHYAMRVWDRSHYGSFHLYGHSHGNLLGSSHSFDVGVDSIGYKPMSLQEMFSIAHFGPYIDAKQRDLILGGS